MTEKSDREKRQQQETETARRVEWAEPALAPEKGGDPRQWGGPAQSSSTRRAPRRTNVIKNTDIDFRGLQDMETPRLTNAIKNRTARE